jgi:hypothetical protein
MNLFCAIAVNFLSLVLSPDLPQQQGATDEITARVPALDQFHTVIFTLWHEAWPKKDTTMLATLLPEIDKGAKSVADAQLPGILRDKKTSWDKGIEGLRESVTEYRAAIESKNGTRLLAAAERVHAAYERLVRIIRPVIKEIDEFHAVLYLLYHYYWPENNLPKMRESAASLNDKMAALMKSTLPQRLAAKADAFKIACAKLAFSVREFQDALEVADEAARADSLKTAVSHLHSCYLSLEKTLEGNTK